jgi:hypothetical protein
MSANFSVFFFLNSLCKYIRVYVYKLLRVNYYKLYNTERVRTVGGSSLVT